MPKKYTKKRVGRRRRPTRGAIYGAAAGQLWKDVKQLKSLVNTEYKFYDVDQQFINLPTCTTAASPAPLIMWLNQVPPGTGVSQREGASIKVTSIQHHCTFDNTVASSTPCRVRMLFFLYLRPMSSVGTPAFASLEQVLDKTTIDPIDAFRNLSYRSDISIIKDVVYRLDTSSPNDQQIMKFYKKVNFHSTWGTGDTDGTFATKNMLFCMVWSDQAQTVKPRIRCTTRIRYIDN